MALAVVDRAASPARNELANQLLSHPPSPYSARVFRGATRRCDPSRGSDLAAWPPSHRGGDPGPAPTLDETRQPGFGQRRCSTPDETRGFVNPGSPSRPGPGSRVSRLRAIPISHMRGDRSAASPNDRHRQTVQKIGYANFVDAPRGERQGGITSPPPSSEGRAAGQAPRTTGGVPVGQICRPPCPLGMPGGHLHFQRTAVSARPAPVGQRTDST